MNYQFQNEREYTLFKDAFYFYFRHANDPLKDLIESRFSYKTQSTLIDVGRAHYDMFVRFISQQDASEQLLRETKRKKEVAKEMNYRILAYLTDINEYSPSWHDWILAYQSIFPCSYVQNGVCGLSLPDRYEELLTEMLRFFDAVDAFELERLADFLMQRYQNVDRDSLFAELAILQEHFVPNDLARRIIDNVNSCRRQNP